MPLEIMILNLFQWLSAFLLLSLAIYSIKFRGLPSVCSLLMFFLLCGLWALLAALNLHIDSFETKVLLNRIRMVMPPLLPLSIFSLACTLRDGKAWPKWIWIAFSIIPLTSIVLIASPQHELFIGNYHLVNWHGYPLLAFSNGPWFQVHNIQARILTLASIGLIVTANRNLNAFHRMNALLISLAIFAPFLIDTIAVMYYEVLRFLQLTPALLALSGLAMAFVIFKRNILDVIPFARSQILDNTPDLYLVFDSRNRLVDFNLNAQAAFGFTEKMMGSRFVDVLGLEPGLLEHMQTSKNWQKSGEHFEIINQPLQNGLVKQIGLLTIFKNVTLQKKVELELIEINNMKTHLLAVMGHDLQGTLTGLALTAENIAGNFKSYAPQDLQAILEAIRYSSQSCVGLVEQLLVWSKSQMGVLQTYSESFEMETMVRDTLAFLQPAIIDKNIQVNVLSRLSSAITSDRNIIQTVLRNLLSNSIRFTPESGTIAVHMELVGSSLKVSVVDSGGGVEAAREQDIFEARNDEKSGIGLYLCSEFIKRLGGKIWADSTTGFGTFHFTIPIIDGRTKSKHLSQPA